MNIALLIRNRLKELKLGQRDLARAAHVTESYISQLLTQKKLPPAPNRTDMYEKIGRALKLPEGQLAQLADQQRREQLRKRLGDQPTPLLHNVRELILRKCHPRKTRQIRDIFEKQHFGELERFVTQKLLGVVKSVARQELDNPTWVRKVARLSKKSYPQTRVTSTTVPQRPAGQIMSQSLSIVLLDQTAPTTVRFASRGLSRPGRG